MEMSKYKRGKRKKVDTLPYLPIAVSQVRLHGQAHPWRWEEDRNTF
jgi:hypothetical protein